MCFTGSKGLWQAAAMKGSIMAVADAIIEQLGTDSFADYEQSIYDSYQEKAEREIVNTLNDLLSSEALFNLLKIC